MRITKKDLEIAEKRVNDLTKQCNIRVSYRYNYVALDLETKQGTTFDTLVTGLTKREAHRILYAIEQVLSFEK